MARLRIRKYPDPVLREQCEEVSNFDHELHTLLDDMVETMYEAEGVGLAAPQVGVIKRITVIDVSASREELIEVINPEITWSEGEIPSEEGCLSIPEYRDTITRNERVGLRAYNRHGEPFELDAEGLLSICVQHELDHLEGTLFIDRLSRLKRDIFRRWLKKHGEFDEN